MTYNAQGIPDKEQLVVQYAPLVKRIAHHLMARLPASVLVDDLIQNGMLGLLDAIHRFEDDQGAQFETYAVQRIRGAMLDGLREKFGAAAGIAVTGIAGPGGGSPDKPVGLVFIGSFAGGARRVERFSFPGNRATVRARAVAAALNQLRRQLLDEH